MEKKMAINCAGLIESSWYSFIVIRTAYLYLCGCAREASRHIKYTGISLHAVKLWVSLWSDYINSCIKLSWYSFCYDSNLNWALPLPVGFSIGHFLLIEVCNSEIEVETCISVPSGMFWQLRVVLSWMRSNNKDSSGWMFSRVLERGIYCWNGNIFAAITLNIVLPKASLILVYPSRSRDECVSFQASRGSFADLKIFPTKTYFPRRHSSQ